MMGYLIDGLYVLLVAAILLTFIWAGAKRPAIRTNGWRLMLGGAAFAAFIIPVTALVTSFLPSIAGDLVGPLNVLGLLSLGAALLGLRRWMPHITQVHEVESFSQELVTLYTRLESNNRSLLARSEFSNTLSQSAHDAIISINQQGAIIFWNQGAMRLFGYSEQEALGKPVSILLPELYQEALLICLARANQGDQSVLTNSVFELDARRKDGELFPVEISMASWTQYQDIHYAAVVRDITQRKIDEKGNERIHQSRVAISRLLQISLEPITLKEQLDKALKVILSVEWLEIESKGSIFLFNEETKMLELTAQMGLAQHLLSACAEIPLGYCLCGRAAESQKLVFSSHIDHRHDVTFDGIKPHGHYCLPIMIQDKLLGVVNTYVGDGHEKDGEEKEFLKAIANTLAGLIQRKRIEQKLKKLAHFDPLTGLANRKMLQEQLGKYLARAKRDDEQLALMFLDLDKFKHVNDTMGHDVGDLLLKAVSKKIIACVRKSDLVARLGGDEFTVVLTQTNLRGDIEAVANKIITQLNEPFHFGEHTCEIGTSIGISLFPKHGETQEALIKAADTAMYQVKKRGRNDFLIYNNTALSDETDETDAT
ncbi:MAG: diguanylate cyclase [Magnetococcales bacterium]|nr:diguanylate cyclase [Magnetococcales bacterium]